MDEEVIDLTEESGPSEIKSRPARPIGEFKPRSVTERDRDKGDDRERDRRDDRDRERDRGEVDNLSRRRRSRSREKERYVLIRVGLIYIA